MSPMLREAIFLLKEVRTQQSNTRDGVTKCLDKTISNLESLIGERYSEPEIITLILEELSVLFSEFPELQM